MAARAEQIVLVGLPGAGKSTVGPLLARKLGWSFIDLDEQIEAASGLSVPRIFAERGEAGFRSVERDLTGRLASVPQLVLAPGGGWIMHNRLPGAAIVWLRVTPEQALVRLGDAVARRPLLQPAPLERMKQLLAERLPHYEQADLQIDTNDQTADAVAEAIAVAVERDHGEEKE